MELLSGVESYDFIFVDLIIEVTAREGQFFNETGRIYYL